MMKPETRFSANPDVVAREVGGEHVLLQLAIGTYYGLNEVGGRVWQLLEKGDLTLAQLSSAIASEFDAARDVIQRDIGELATDLAQNGLVNVR